MDDQSNVWEKSVYSAGENALTCGYTTADMAERTDQQTRDNDRLDEFSGAGLDDLDEQLGTEAESEGDATIGDRIRNRISIRSLGLTVLVLGIPAAIASSFIPFIGGPLGLVAGAFLLGVIGAGYSYASVASVGALLGGFGALVGDITFAVAADAILTLGILGAIGGGAIAALGLYLGRDLRDGLTREI